MVVDNSVMYFVTLQPTAWSGGVICVLMLVFIVYLVCLFCKAMHLQTIL